ncbi:cytochrome c peroxidase [Helicobacter sp. 11S03491-1]|uniref:cytochrome-c peroxidase n=1 Tax=Helicobacter sp. 11S03491-1 TaxID=1476196 RepID=UPI002150B1BC|nr:cytochrome c peroxidase [Helicobacter sp. 11S03491-1]
MKCLICIILSAYTVYGLPNDINKIKEMYQKPSQYWEKPFVDTYIIYEELAPLPKIPPFPKDNPYTKSKAQLGEKLFNDPILSLSGQISCANCHKKEFAYSDNKKVSYGHNHQKGKRKSPSLIMSGFGKEKLRDGRAKNLEEQVLFPIKDPKEMALNLDLLLQRLNHMPKYQKEFQAVFGKPTITLQAITQAIATYERTLLPNPTRFDQFLQGSKNALNDEEIWGLHLFRTKARCMNCHYGISLSDQKYHNLGLTYYGRKYEDLGRYEVTKNPQDIGSFKTPSLRQISRTSPYMHNGLFPTIRGILNAYNAGMFHPKPLPNQNNLFFPKTSPLLQKLNLNPDEIKAIEAFLKTL